MAKNKNNNSKCWQGCGETGTLINCWWEGKLVQPLWKALRRALKKLRIEVPYDSVIMFLGMYPKECKVGHSRDTCILMLITALFTVTNLWKQPRCPTFDEWIKKLWYIYTIEYYSNIRTNDMWFEGVLSELSQDQKYKNHIFSHMLKIDPKINI
jgi:hypothetical protein